MKKNDLKENSSVFIIGKGVIIIVIIVTSALSFMLGFFVGKSYQPAVVNQTSVFPLQESIDQKNSNPEEKVVQTQEIQKPIVIQKTQETQKSQRSKQTQETKKTAKTEETQGTPEVLKYAVQAGAFKDASDANALKSKLAKKGYKAYVTNTETKRHENMYKVMIGKFVNRKEAELLSIKLKKSEGLQTFVTFKTGQEGVR